MTITDLVNESHAVAREKGWWEEGDARNVGTLLALLHSEITEALEEWRSGRPLNKILFGVDGKPEKPGGFPIELADLLIRVGDLCGGLGIPLETAVEMKMAYNRTRPYRHGGKIA